MEVTIYHNPRCSKSRATLELLRARGIEPRVVNYLDNPPGAVEIERLARLCGLQPRALLRRGEPAYRELGLDDPSLSTGQLCEAMHQHPILIERPIVVAGGRAALGRPPENVLSILPA